MDQPMVSAIITSFHRMPQTVANAIESVARQSYPNMEIIVVDDNEDGSEYSIQLSAFIHCNYPDVLYVKQAGNQGACAARNLGIFRSSGKYIAFLDDDDLWAPEKISVQVETAERHGECTGLVYCYGTVVNERTEPPQITEYRVEEPTENDITFYDMLKQDHIGSTSNPLILREAVMAVGGFTRSLPARQDYEMWLRLSQKYKITRAPGNLFFHYIHSGDQITRDPGKGLCAICHIYREFRKEYEQDVSLKRSIYARIYSASKDAGIRRLWILKLKYYLTAVQDELRKRKECRK